MKGQPLIPCQRDLPRGMLTRDYEEVCRALNSCPRFDLEDEVLDRADLLGLRPVRVLSVACGAGSDIEELVRRFGSMLDDWSQGKIVGLARDLNPLPEWIPDSVLEIDPQTGDRVEGASFDLVTQFDVDDLCTLETIEDGSVDVLWCVSGYPYVADTLGALSNGWRVLREPGDGYRGGVMIVECPFFLMSEPNIHQVFGSTPGVRDAFSLHVVGEDIHEYGHYVVARKSPGVRFEGFPYRLIEERPGFVNPLHTWHEHCRVGIYEYIGE